MSDGRPCLVTARSSRLARPALCAQSAPAVQSDSTRRRPDRPIGWSPDGTAAFRGSDLAHDRHVGNPGSRCSGRDRPGPSPGAGAANRPTCVISGKSIVDERPASCRRWPTGSTRPVASRTPRRSSVRSRFPTTRPARRRSDRSPSWLPPRRSRLRDRGPAWRTSPPSRVAPRAAVPQEVEAIRNESAEALFALAIQAPFGNHQALCPGRRLSPRPCSTAGPTTPKPAGCWATCLTRAAGRRRSPSSRSARAWCFTRSTAGSTRAGSPTSNAASFPPPGSAHRGRPWLPAAEADALRDQIERGWRIETEHFQIQSDVPLSEAIAFGRQLESFHDLFYSLLADVIGEELPPGPSGSASTGEAAQPPRGRRTWSSISPPRRNTSAHLRPIEGPGVEEALGIYIPPPIQTGSGPRPTSSATRAASSTSPRPSSTRSRISSCSSRAVSARTRTSRTSAITGSSRGWAPTSRPSPSSPTARFARRLRRPADRGREVRMIDPGRARPDRPARPAQPDRLQGVEPGLPALRRGDGPGRLPDARQRRQVPRAVS